MEKNEELVSSIHRIVWEFGCSGSSDVGTGDQWLQGLYECSILLLIILLISYSSTTSILLWFPPPYSKYFQIL